MSEPETTPAAPPQEQQQEQQPQPPQEQQQQPPQEQQPSQPQQDTQNAAAVSSQPSTTVQSTSQDSAELETLKKANQELQDKIQELTKQLSEAQSKAAAAPSAPAPPPAPAAPPPPPPPAAPAPPPPPPGAGPPPPPPPPGGGPPPPPPPPGGKGGPPGPPPPPGKGGPPPPPGGKGGPPPPGGAKGKKPPLKPKSKLKNFNWVVVPPIKLPSTLWEKANDDNVLKTLNFDEIETMFGMSAANVSSTPTAGATKGSKPQVVSLLDMKRSNNISIALSRFGKVSPADIKKGILELNEQLLSIENLNTLVNFVPTQEEIDLLNDYDGDKNQLGVPEKFFLEISQIPLLEQRLKAMVAKRLFTTKIGAILDSLKTINTAVHEVSSCKKLIEVFEIILGIGNYLNGGTNRGQAYGFKLDALGKLTDLRSNTGGTLINYVAKISDSKGIANFPDELKTVNDASKETLQGAITDLSKLKGELNLIKTEGSNPAHNSPGDKFRSVMTAFVDQATKDFEQAEKLANETEAAHTTMCKFFVEDPKSDSLQFFETIQKFLSAWDKALKENKKPGKK